MISLSRTLLLAILGTLSALPSAEARSRHRTVAVLAFRQDVAAHPKLAERIAERIRTLTGLRVIGPTEARQKIGAGVDSAVARCQGKPRCVGALGSRLGAHEVILVGMSSLGDVIIQISRILTTSHRILSSVAHTAPPNAHIRQTLIDRWIHRLLPALDFLRYGYIRVKSNRRGARVLLDKHRRGATPLPGPLKVRAPSTHDIRVTAKGYVPFSAQVAVPPDATIRVNATLVPVSSSGTPYYRKWWFWTALASGAALVAGLTAGLTLGLRPASRTVPAVIRW